MDSNENPVEHLLSLLQPEKLETPAQMAVQLAACDEVFGFVDVSNLLDGLFAEENAPNILALLVSSCRLETISEWLLEYFPGDYYQELTLDIPFQALSILSRTLISLTNVCLDIPQEVMQNHYLISVAPQLLIELLSYDPSVTTSAHVELPDINKGTGEKRSGIRFKHKHKPQTQGNSKRHQPRSAPTLLSSLLLRHLSELGYEAPVYQRDREKIAQAIMEHLQRALVLAIHEHKRRATASAIKRSFYKLSSHQRPAAPPTHQPVIPETNNEQMLAPLPQVQPIKASLCFDSMDGFGPWRIQIAGRTEKHLREARKFRSEQFKAIMKKIRELSHGHFSDDNQRRLNRARPEAVPVFEAKIARDTRIIYQVDCSRDYDTEMDLQVLKIFGVYAHSKPDEQFWDSVGVQLGRNGKEYRRRCEFRSRIKAKDGVFIPAMFPPIEDGSQSLTESPQEIPMTDLQEIHSLLVLEKFVTFSQVLLKSILDNVDIVLPFDMTSQEKEIVQHSGSSFVIGRSGTGKTTSMVFKMFGIEHAYAVQINRFGVERPRQVFVTQSRVLAKKVQEYFKKLLNSLTATTNSDSEEEGKIKGPNQQTSQSQSEEMLDQDEEYALSGDLPSKFSLLSSEHFPLFISFDQLCKLIEADVLGERKKVRTQPLIDYDAFLKSYWPHFPWSLTKGLDPVSVFSEFIGVIKGSEDTLKTSEGFLDANTYRSLSHRTQPAFSEHRSLIHELFMVYTRQKSARGQCDTADRTHEILGALKNDGIGPLGKRLIDFLYVDESQDNLLIDALLLRLLCKNPNGLFFAGDTAQTIAAGCSFRFDDLKALIYRAEENHNISPALTLQRSSPKTFQLTVNYRSHGGIVDAAHSIIELLMRFFPYSIDSMERERGVVAGAKPVFFRGFENFSTADFESFFFGKKRGGIEFGHAQCILVRDNACRKRLSQEVGNIGQIMSIYDCKGLEFDDVLLYNFFEESPVELKSWRVLLSALPPEAKKLAPAFNELRHAGISSELKKLYVAITRARKNLWIVDRSEKSEPMRQLWASRDQILCRTSDGGVPQLAIPSTEEEWANQGLKLFQHKRYYQARNCFERASLPQKTQICQAYYLRDEAQKMPVRTSERKELTAKYQAFMMAAEAFCRSARYPDEREKEKRAYFRIAAECYEAGQQLKLAAQTYVLAREFNTAAKLYRALEMFGPAMDVIREYREEMDEKLVKEITHISRLYYLAKQDMENANPLFASDKEELTFLQERDLGLTEAKLLELRGKIIEAAHIHFNEGRMIEAAKLFFKNPDDQRAVQLGVESIILELWKGVTFDREWKKNSTSRRKHLDLLAAVNLSPLDPGLENEIAMFRAIVSLPPTHSEFRRLGRVFAEASNWTASLVCFDSVFANPPQLQGATPAAAVEITEDFLCYVRLLRKAALHPTPQNEAGFQKLFGFVPRGPARYLVLQGTALHALMENQRSAVPQDDGVVIHEDTLCSALKELLRTRLLARIKQEHQGCCHTQSLNPCLSFTFASHCEKPWGRCQHTDAMTTTELAAMYKARVRLHMQQLLILRIWHLEDIEEQQAATHLDKWVDRLYRSMLPSHPLGGIPLDLDTLSIPEFNAAFKVLQTVFPTTTYQEVPTQFLHIQPQFLTRFMQIALYGFNHHATEALAYVRRAACWTAPKPRSFMRTGNPNTFIMGDVFSSHMAGPTSRALIDGLWLIMHVVKTQLRIDVGVLCDHIDRQVALFCATQKWDSSTPLHSLTLPRSQILYLLQSHTYESLRSIAQEKRIYLRILVDTLSKLANYLFYGKTTLINHGMAIASIFILRLFRAISFLGFNAIFVDVPTRKAILKLFNSFQGAYHSSDPSPLHRSLSSYTDVDNWFEVTRLVQEKTFEADFAISLQHSSLESDNFPGTQTIVFTTFGDALSQMGYLPCSLQVATRDPKLLRHPSAEQSIQPGIQEIKAENGKHGFNGGSKTTHLSKAILSVSDEVSAALKIQVVYRRWRKRAESHPGLPVRQSDPSDLLFCKREDYSIEVGADQGKHGINAGAGSKNPFKAAPSIRKETSAALRIQTAYRRWKRYLKFQPSARRSQRMYFQACLQEAQKIQWPHGHYYRSLFLAALPYILDTLDKIESQIHLLKQESKSQFYIVQTRHLEAVDKKLITLVNALKEIQIIRLTLQPTSDIHRRRDLQALRTNVQLVWDLFYRKGESWNHGISDKYLKAGYSIIIDAQGRPAKQAKPVLHI